MIVKRGFLPNTSITDDLNSELDRRWKSMDLPTSLFFPKCENFKILIMMLS